MTHFHGIGFEGQSNPDGWRADPSALGAYPNTTDQLIPMNCNGNGFETQAGWGGTAGVTYNVNTPYDALIPLQPEVNTDGSSGTHWTGGGITVPAGSYSHGYGPEITCARTLHRDDYRVAVMKRAVGGTGLGPAPSNPYYHNPQAPSEESYLLDDDGNTPGRQGRNYWAAMQRAEGMAATLAGLGHSLSWAGWVYWQGENDAADATSAAEYAFHLSRKIRFTRARLGVNMPWVVVLTRSGGYQQQVRDAQIEVARTLPGVRTYDPLGLPLYTDNVHYWQDAHVTSGNDIAAIFQEMGVGA